MDSVADDGGRSFGFGGEGVGGFFGGAGGVGGGLGRRSGVLGVGTRDMSMLRFMLAGEKEGTTSLKTYRSVYSWIRLARACPAPIIVCANDSPQPALGSPPVSHSSSTKSVLSSHTLCMRRWASNERSAASVASHCSGLVLCCVVSRTWPTGLLPSGAGGAGLNEYQGCSSLARSFWRGSLGERGKEEAPTERVRVAGGRRTRVSVPLERGRGGAPGAGTWNTAQFGISISVVIGGGDYKGGSIRGERTGGEI